MGKGDKKSKKGKISMGSYGIKRPRKKKTAGAAATKTAAAKTAKKAAPKKAAPKKAAKKDE